MFSHTDIWAAIDALARRQGLSLSALARSAGLDPTAFNPSKRRSPDGKPRWPSTESLAKILAATGTTADAFADLMRGGHGLPAPQRIPLIGFAEAGDHGYFDDAGFPVGGGWDHLSFPDVGDENAYALEVTGASMEPAYRAGDILIVAPNASLRRGDRVVVKTKAGEVMAKQLTRRTADTVELASLNPDYQGRKFAVEDVEWMARILWASQ